MTQDLVVAWEDAYRRYQNAVGSEVTVTSQAVAGAWRKLAACADLPWWLSAAVRSAAQAFEHQAEAWAGCPNHDGVAPASTDDDEEEEDEEDTAYGTIVLPIQQGSRRSCGCGDEPSVTTHPAPAARATV